MILYSYDWKKNNFILKTQNTTEKMEVPVKTTEVIKEIDEKIFQEVCLVLGDIKESDEIIGGAEDIMEKLKNPQNINILLRKEKVPIGFICSIPQVVACDELATIDSLMEKDPSRLYVYMIGVVPEYRSKGGAFEMIFLLVEEAGKRRINKFAMHTRVAGGLSEAVQKCFGKMITKVRRIENWPFYPGGQEPTDYLEGTYE
jgi:ribosomal protein S18 acetylase RimI-like enzyme